LVQSCVSDHESTGANSGCLPPAADHNLSGFRMECICDVWSYYRQCKQGVRHDVHACNSIKRRTPSLIRYIYNEPTKNAFCYRDAVSHTDTMTHGYTGQVTVHFHMQTTHETDQDYFVNQDPWSIRGLCCDLLRVSSVRRFSVQYLHKQVMILHTL
jgi:hypothetical protein